MKTYAVMAFILAPLWFAAAIALVHAYVTRDTNPDK